MAGRTADLIRALRPFFVSRSGENTLKGTLLPDTDAAHNLGGVERRWQEGYFKDLKTDTLTVREIRNFALRPNLLRNGGFEQTNKDNHHYPLGWTMGSSTPILSSLASDADDPNFPEGTVEPTVLSLSGVE